ncbi:MAG: RluA family pseudouridine synthase [Clostridia bacterium]|nr:RluA family pseudouridine synthase [Clostridia bacterium]
MREDAFELLCVLAEQSGARLDSFLAEHTSLSRSAAAKLIEGGSVLVNGLPQNKRYITKENDQIAYFLPEPLPSEAEPENIPLDILYEDSDLLVICKKKGMVVHPAPGNERGTLVNALLYHCKDSLSGIGGTVRPGIVHRIDKDTAGLLAVAKNDFTHLSLSAQLATHHMHRVYHALANGGFKEEKGTVCAPIGRHPVDRKKMAVISDGSHSAKDATTHYEVLESHDGISYLRLQLETGRTHQIRVHMAHLGHPLLGDTLYGGGTRPFEKKHAPLLQGQCLFAKELSFTHPRTGQEVHFEAPLPADFEQLLKIWRQT